MSKVTFFFSSLIFSILVSSCQTIPKTELQKKFPLEMLSDDYGILIEKDVKFYADESNPLRLEKESGNHGFWICVERKNIDFKCNDFGPSTSRPIEHNGEAEIHLKYAHINHLYIWGQGLEIDSCNWKVAQWSNLSRNAEHVCVAGYRISNSKLPNGETEYSWTFDRLKTKSGCDFKVHGRCENLDPDEYLESLVKTKTKQKK